jgi:hypothetical protein
MDMAKMQEMLAGMGGGGAGGPGGELLWIYFLFRSDSMHYMWHVPNICILLCI